MVLQTGFVGRQPIHGPGGEVEAYELLFRTSGDATSSAASGDAATATVILRAFSDFGLENLVGRRTAFINMTRSFLTGERLLPFGPEGVVLEILEDIPVDEALLRGLSALRELGYTLAIDDWVAGGPRDVLLPMVQYVKIDVEDYTLEQLPEIAAIAGRYGALLVAERVETREQHEVAVAAGFHLIQGWYRSKAETVAVSTLAAGRMNALELLMKLAEPDVSLNTLTAILSRDPALSYRMLRAASSAALSAATPVRNVKDALVRVGLEHLRAWLMLVVLDEKLGLDEELSVSLLIRARLGAMLAPALGADAEEAFTIGLLSGLAKAHRAPMATLLEGLPLAADLSQALLQRTGALGAVLDALDAHATCDSAAIRALDLLPAQVVHATIDSIAWAVNVTSDFHPVGT